MRCQGNLCKSSTCDNQVGVGQLFCSFLHLFLRIIRLEPVQLHTVNHAAKQLSHCVKLSQLLHAYFTQTLKQIHKLGAVCIQERSDGTSYKGILKSILLKEGADLMVH